MKKSKRCSFFVLFCFLWQKRAVLQDVRKITAEIAKSKIKIRHQCFQRCRITVCS